MMKKEENFDKKMIPNEKSQRTFTPIFPYQSSGAVQRIRYPSLIIPRCLDSRSVGRGDLLTD